MLAPERGFFVDNLLVHNHFIIAMISWTGLALWKFEFPFPGSLTSTFLVPAPGESGRCAVRAEDAQGTLTQSHISPSILVYEGWSNVSPSVSDSSSYRGTDGAVHQVMPSSARLNFGSPIW